MTYTVRYCHLEEEPKLNVGDKLIYGSKIGTAGNTGKSTGRHLHIDCVCGKVDEVYRLADMEHHRQEPAPKQLNYFIDEDLFKSEIEITTYFNDYRYFDRILHPGYDAVPKNRIDYDIFWNRSHVGTVISKGFDMGYGNYINITFEVA